MKNIKLFNIGWGLTNKCNMNCKFCYSKKARSDYKELSIKDWKSFIDLNYNYIDSINYGTGENSILNEFFQFVYYVKTKYPKIKQALTTNGFISVRVAEDKQLMKIFQECIDEVDVSIDFYSKELHNKQRGNPFAFDWAVNTLKLCQKSNKLVTIVFVGTEETLKRDNIIGLFNLAKKYDAILRMNIYRPVSNDPNINKQFILSYDTLISTLNFINENYKIISLSDILLGTVFAGQKGLKENTGNNSIRILPDGSICPSTYLISEKFKNKYSILQGKILDTLCFEDFKNAPIPRECKNCEFVQNCKGGTFDRRYLWYGTLFQRDPYCPFRLGKKLPKEKYKIYKTERVSVHDEYLPTLFFKN